MLMRRGHTTHSPIRLARQPTFLLNTWILSALQPFPLSLRALPDAAEDSLVTPLAPPPLNHLPDPPPPRQDAPLDKLGTHPPSYTIPPYPITQQATMHHPPLLAVQ